VGELRGSDLITVADQLGRDPTTPFTVVARCPDGHPLVIRNAPIDAEGKPFPTLFWLTCPAASKAISRLESEGWIARLNERLTGEPELAAALEGAHAEYAKERARGHPGAEAFGGVGGTRTGVKCLHAHYGNHLAGGDDPVGKWTAERFEPVHDERPGRVAAIDQGTNSIRLLVAEPEGDGFRELARDMVITRLGQGVDRTGTITPEALERTVGVLARYCRRARALHAERIRVAATAVVRDASNRDELGRAVLEHAGSELEVLSGEEEAARSFLGATHGLDAPGPFLVLDIGGGSTEFVVGTDAPTAAISVQMGSVRLTERFVRHDPPTDREVDAMHSFVGERLDEVARAVPVGDARTLVAVAGTSTTVQAIALDLPHDDPEAVHRTGLARDAVDRVLRQLAEMTTAERASLPVMPSGRADVIVAGAVILVEVMGRFAFEEALVSETDILDGLALEMLDEGTTA
jgi:exopolyphosphatase/guanosine-5'-triphosphate,3'-diphosphate pyrophosphatase